MVDLVDVRDFGSIAAENDRNLREYFVTTPVFDALLDQEKYLVLGRKGMGKTALYRGLEDSRDPDTFVTGLVFSDYPWKLHDHALNKNAAEAERHLNSWRFLALVELSRLGL